ncbi:hypothetical protein FACS189421_11990 [Bacteroidia bacterium]|nr:hypothetical protein FACS189421_11990 [Bacteroidia bacterium]GHT04894.1 hypothetical protein FACS189423_08260 [Bacteroidia bacterium]GHT52948.1 hypothetical protein FACS189440_22360 [Bacteroidia bacterium]
MKQYKIQVSETAKQDIDDLYYFIVEEYDSLLTAKNYISGIKATIQSLSTTAEVYQIQNTTVLRLFGPNVRRINYKKMAIIYTVHGDVVLVHRVISAAIIT